MNYNTYIQIKKKKKKKLTDQANKQQTLRQLFNICALQHACH